MSDLIQSNTVNILNRIAKCWLIITITPFLLALSSIKSDPLLNLITIESYDFLNLYTVKITRIILGLGFQALFFMFILYVLPSKRLNIKSIIYGGIISSFLFEILQLINIFLTKRAFSADSSHIYGTMALVVVLFLVWLRLIWLVILVGAAFTISCQRILYFNENKFNKDSPLSSLSNCLKIYKEISEYFKLSNKPITFHLLSKNLQIENKEIIFWIDYLIHFNLIRSTSYNQNEYFYLPTYHSLLEEKKDPNFIKTLLLNELCSHIEKSKENRK